jgi:hypothetical protein
MSSGRLLDRSDLALKRLGGDAWSLGAQCCKPGVVYLISDQTPSSSLETEML